MTAGVAHGAHDPAWTEQLELGVAIHRLGREPVAPVARQRWIALAIGYAQATATGIAPRQLDLYWVQRDGIELETPRGPQLAAFRRLGADELPPRIPTREAAKFHVALDRLERTRATTRRGS